MRRRRLLGLVVVSCIGALLTGTVFSSSPAENLHLSATETESRSRAGLDGDEAPADITLGQLQASGPMIIDHTTTDLSQVPEYWIEQAKAVLRVSYGHTSHGSQIITGMDVLEGNTPSGLYDFNTNGAVKAGVLSVADATPDGDLGNPNRTDWEARTREYLDGAGSNRNVVIWSWCGQVSDATFANIQTYLNLMDGLEQDYPNVTFVYMTGHLDGSGVEGNLNVRNEQIRRYCRNHNKVLFDFADIESYDPAGHEFLSRYANDNCDYSCSSGTCNWANRWCAKHGSDPLCNSCSCAHSQPLNCNLKARAFWWMMARIAGWPGPDQDTAQKSPSTAVAYHGEVVTYTVEVRDLAVPGGTTVFMTDVVPSGLEYVPDSLGASSGLVNDDDAPTLSWSGVLDPPPLVLVTYAVTVTASSPSAAVNTAIMGAPGYTSVERSATLLLNPLAVYLPFGVRQ